MLSKIKKMEAVKDSTQFDEKRTDIFRRLDIIIYDISQKVKECSK